MSRKKINIEDTIDFITGGDLSDPSDLSAKSDFEELPGTHFMERMMKMSLWRMRKAMNLFPQFRIKSNVMKI